MLQKIAIKHWIQKYEYLHTSFFHLFGNLNPCLRNCVKILTWQDQLHPFSGNFPAIKLMEMYLKYLCFIFWSYHSCHSFQKTSLTCAQLMLFVIQEDQWNWFPYNNLLGINIPSSLYYYLKMAPSSGLWYFCWYPPAGHRWLKRKMA